MDLVKLKRGLIEQIYDELRERVVNLILKPGTRINIPELEEEFEVSPTPIKGALKKLSERGLVVDRFGAGYFVDTLSTKKMEEIYSIRKIFESHALETSISLFPKEILRQLQKEFTSLFDESDQEKMHYEFYRLDQTVHLGVINYSENQTLKNFYYQIYDFVKIAQHSYRLERVGLIKQIETHLSIVEAIIEGDLARSKELTENHIVEVRGLVVKALMSNGQFWVSH
ncbi:MAG: GntR family transcriptional regulator [Candidatus Atribacteria bacterium]|nr:GntR family transcriptional regulator [Candidatus Atribacteria bacterium]